MAFPLRQGRAGEYYKEGNKAPYVAKDWEGAEPGGFFQFLDSLWALEGDICPGPPARSFDKVRRGIQLKMHLLPPFLESVLISDVQGPCASRACHYKPFPAVQCMAKEGLSE